MGDVLSELGMTADALREEVAEMDPPRGSRRSCERVRGGPVDLSWRHYVGMTEEEARAALASGQIRLTSREGARTARRQRENLRDVLPDLADMLAEGIG